MCLFCWFCSIVFLGGLPQTTFFTTIPRVAESFSANDPAGTCGVTTSTAWTNWMPPSPSWRCPTPWPSHTRTSAWPSRRSQGIPERNVDTLRPMNMEPDREMSFSCFFPRELVGGGIGFEKRHVSERISPSLGLTGSFSFETEAATRDAVCSRKPSGFRWFSF